MISWRILTSLLPSPLRTSVRNPADAKPAHGAITPKAMTREHDQERPGRRQSTAAPPRTMPRPIRSEAAENEAVGAKSREQVGAIA